MKRECQFCVYSWWPRGMPRVEMDGLERTLGNGGLGECCCHAPEYPDHGPRHFPIIAPDDWCGEFLGEFSLKEEA
jgi:hypothetical protein